MPFMHSVHVTPSTVNTERLYSLHRHYFVTDRKGRSQKHKNKKRALTHFVELVDGVLYVQRAEQGLRSGAKTAGRPRTQRVHPTEQ